MDDLGNRIKKVTHELRHYVETRLELTVLNFSDKITYLIGQSIQQLAGYAILGVGLLFGLTALAIYLGELLDEEWAGYLIVSAPFLIVGLIFVIAKPSGIARRIQAQILAELLSSLPKKEKDIKQLPKQETKTKDFENNG